MHRTLNFGLGYNIARIFAGKHRKNLNQICSVSIVATGDMLELLGQPLTNGSFWLSGQTSHFNENLLNK